MKKDPKIFLEHILESISHVERYTKAFTKSHFLKNPQLQDAVTRRLEIIGEAMKNLPKDVKDKNKKVPWKKISGMRDILIHEYFGADLDLIWKVVKKDIPPFKDQIKKLLES